MATMPGRPVKARAAAIAMMLASVSELRKRTGSKAGKRATRGAAERASSRFGPPRASPSALDPAPLDRRTDFLLDCGADGITVLGILGEAQKLDADEAEAVAARAIARAGRAPVIVGVSAHGFAAMRRPARAAMDRGAAGVMPAPHRDLRTDDQNADFVAQAAEAIGPGVPICLQDHPQATGVAMSVPLVLRILAAVPSVAMLKHEDRPGLEKLSALRSAMDAGQVRRVPILCGNGGLFLDCALARGADGAMTGHTFPHMLADLVRPSGAGDGKAAEDLFDAHRPLMRYEQQPGIGPAVRKHL